jgi:thiol-disulfide isomerase/thioredoxin
MRSNNSARSLRAEEEATVSKQRQPALEHHKASTPTAAGRRRVGGVLTVLILATVVLAVGAILLLKEGRPPTSTVVDPQSGSSSPAGGATASGSAADQLQAALTANKPALVFMHSTTCQSCIDMMRVVDQVYPEFAAQIALVDVDVYDEANEPLMQALGLRYIPTIVVYDRAGKAAQNVGAMQADAFRTFLRQRALGG